MAGIQSVAAGNSYSLFLTSIIFLKYFKILISNLANRTVFGCGLNNYGQLGTGITNNVYTPIQIPNLFGVNYITTGDSSSYVLLSKFFKYKYFQSKRKINFFFYFNNIKDNGTLFVFGQNSYGQLGVGDTSSKLSPTPVTFSNNISAVSAGNFFVFILGIFKEEFSIFFFFCFKSIFI